MILKHILWMLCLLISYSKFTRTYLPATLTSNTVLYSILSKGIHELTEEECLAYFPVLKDCLYMILDQWEEMRKKEEKEKAIGAALSAIATNIK